MSDLDAFLYQQGTAYVRKLRAKKPRQPAEPKPKRRGKQEEIVSVAIRTFIRHALPGAFVFHIPNETGGSRNVKMHLIRRKEQGVVSGVPDLCVTWPGGGIAWIEVKAPGERASDRQREIHAILRDCGQVVGVADSVEAAEAILREAGAPLRGRPA